VVPQVQSGFRRILFDHDRPRARAVVPEDEAIAVAELVGRQRPVSISAHRSLRIDEKEVQEISLEPYFGWIVTHGTSLAETSAPGHDQRRADARLVRVPLANRWRARYAPCRELRCRGLLGGSHVLGSDQPPVSSHEHA